MTKYTPGPWSLFLGNAGYFCVEGIWKADSEADRICGSIGAVASEEEAVANARLIAAAPEMLEALERVVETGEADYETFRMALAAVAKAKGDA